MQDGSGSSARELLRASATDADAVRQYLQSIDAEELNGLLDGIAPKCKAKTQATQQAKGAFLVQDDWLPLVHLLAQCEATRLRAASRIVQVLRRGSPSELESMQLLTEVTLGYARALDELQEPQRHSSSGSSSRSRSRRRLLLDEIRVVLDIVFSFLGEVVEAARPTKVLPQLLGLVPYFLGLMGEIGDEEAGRGIQENLTKLLELPWSCQTVPSLLDVLVDDATLMSRESWQQLQENVERMVTTSPEMASETMNPVIRECVLAANVTGDHRWIDVARYLLRQLPAHLRQEAEFNLQMSFQQSPRIVSLVCESVRSSTVSERDDVDMTDPSSLFDSGLDLALDWRDLFLLLHSLQASKPILHHRTSSSRVATEASVFTDIEQLAWRIVQSDIRVFTTLLLMDISFFWIEQNDTSELLPSKPATALMLLQAIFETASETRSEVLSCLFERSQKPTQRKIAGETLSKLFISQSGKLFPHINAIQDWLSMQFQRSFNSARNFFLIASRLATVYKDLYNFLMVFLRKLLSTGNRSHQQFAVDMWCTWLDHRLPFSEQQEEEIVSALKNSMTACHDIQAWSFGRLEQIFQYCGAPIEGPVISLRKSSWEELRRFLSQEVGKFIQPTTSSIAGYENDDDNDSGDEYDDDDSVLQRFRFDSLDAFYQQNASLDGAAAIGFVFQKVLSCLIGFEKASTRSKVSSEGVPIESLGEKDSDIKQWLVDLVSNWKYFFHWVCQDCDGLLNQSAQGRTSGKSAWWKLVARIYIGCAICNIAIEMLMQQRPVEASGDQDSGDQLSVAFCADDSDISIWSLMEVAFSLHRMIQKLAAHYANEMETSLSKEHVKAVSYGLHRVLQPEKLQILTAIKNNLQATDGAKEPAIERPSGMSFDAVLFTLDSCCSTLGDEDLYGSYFPRDSKTGRQSEAGPILEMLLSIYLNVRDRVMTTPDLSSDDEDDQSACRSQFSVYADSISVKLPMSARHLVTPSKSAKAVVLLDSKGGEEMLEHVCAAIGRTLEVMMKTTSLESVHGQVGVVLQNISCIGPSEGASSCNFVRLSHYFLADVKKCVQLDGFTKLGVACATLSKRLCDIGAAMVDGNVVSSYQLALSSLAYDVLCDNVVYNPRLLRLLSSICLPTHLALRVDTFVTMESKIEGIIRACGLDSGATATTSPDMNESHRQHKAPAKKKRDRKGASMRRKRLRQGFDARSSYGLQVDSDSDSSASYSSDSDESVRSYDSNAVTDASSNISRSSQNVLPNRDRIPHLQSQSSQSIAILAVLNVLEQSQSTLLSAITAKNSGSETCTVPHHEEILGFIRIHELVNQAIYDIHDFSWGTRRVLLKILHSIELGLRIGKASGALRRRDNLEDGFLPDTTICIYEFSVMSALKARTWVDGMKDASQDSGTKTKVSATLLKMDIFFLQVPGTAQSWLKESALSDASKNRLKALVALVKERIAPTDPANVRRGKAKARQRLLGVVPIVRKRRKRLRSRHPIIDAFLNEEDGADAFADLEDFIE
ncbi:hypothetical protein PR002_g7839 [Phytophthora rubi]|uniref:Uncharacterized protein n=1 Tax=Phytophthora rubi TaxID=129364 RepID=A0A6A3N0T4_9STRA|nr:hypothetical protein PR002_g7839 [Phytophthora rubi]